MSSKTITKDVTLTSGKIVTLELSIVGESYGEDADGNRGQYQEFIDNWDCDEELSEKEQEEIETLIDNGRI